MTTLLIIYILQTITGVIYWNKKLATGINCSFVLSACVLPNILLLVSFFAAKINLLKDFNCKSEL